MLYKITIFQCSRLFLLCSPLWIMACDSGSDDNATEPDNTSYISGSISTVTESDTSSSVSGALVLAVDEKGNSYSTDTNRAGKFTLNEVEPSKAYSLLVVDSRSNLVIASLVTNGQHSKAAAVKVSGATELGQVVLNTSEQTAVAPNPSTGVQFDVSTLDTNGDGKISSEEVALAQANTIKNNDIQALTNISLVNYLGDVNTWSLYSTQQRFLNGSGTESTALESKSFRIISSDTVEGPNGEIVSVAREASLDYFKAMHPVVWEVSEPRVPGDMIVPDLLEFGHINQQALDDNIAVCSDPTSGEYTTLYKDTDALATAPSDYDACYGIHVFAEYRYVDSANDRVVYGMKQLNRDGSFSVAWYGLSLPLNFEPGVPVTRTMGSPIVDPIPLNPVAVGKDGYLPPGVVEIMAQADAPNPGIEPPPRNALPEMTETITVDFVPGAIITDQLGNELPVIRIQTDTTIGTYTSSVAYYMVAKYGVKLSASGDGTVDRPWDAAYAESSRFGIISADDTNNSVIFTQTNPDTIGEQAAPGAMLAQGAGFDAAKRDGWLNFIITNHNQFDTYYPMFTDPCAFGDKTVVLPCDPPPVPCEPIEDPNNPGVIECIPVVDPCSDTSASCIPPEPCLPIADPVNRGADNCEPPPPPVPCDPATDPNNPDGRNCESPPAPCVAVPDPANPDLLICEPPVTPPAPIPFGLWLDCDDNGCVTPPAWDPVNFTSISLTAGTTGVTFETDPVHYLAAANVAFHLELLSTALDGMRIPTVLAKTQPIPADATVSDQENVLLVSGSMDIPALSDFPTPGWIEPDNKEANHAELWLVMTLTEDLVETVTDPNTGNSETVVIAPAGSTMFQQPLDFYVVKQP